MSGHASQRSDQLQRYPSSFGFAIAAPVVVASLVLGIAGVWLEARRARGETVAAQRA